MKIALIAPPFIAVPPQRYGGTELFIANLAIELHAKGHQVTVYGNGDSHLPCSVKWRYAHTDWPLEDQQRAAMKNLDHTAWALDDAAKWADVIHLNDAVGVPLTRFVATPVVFTLHHPQEPVLSELYARNPGIHYVTLASWLARREQVPLLHSINHGLPLEKYRSSPDRDDYVAFLGRIAPCKGTHLAVEAALRAGVRLKIAGEIQPGFRDYWRNEVQPRVDGRQIEYVGEADMARKNELLSRARALLFPIQWEEPFGLVMIEAMACGAPVLAFRGGAVEEVVENGVNGWICDDVADMAARIGTLDIPPASCRASVERSFSVSTMAGRYVEVYRQAVARRASATARPVQPLPVLALDRTTSPHI